MIIVEGCDGSGKSNLVGHLASVYGIPIHQRASDSVAGPVPNLYEWALHDVATMADQQVSVYDRHPFISQYIYAPIIGRAMDDRFFSEEAKAAQRKMFRACVVVFCDPGWANVEANIRRDSTPQMEGVVTHAKQLYDVYRTVRQFFPYPSRQLVWDYTTADAPHMLSTIQQHILSGRYARV